MALESQHKDWKASVIRTIEVSDADLASARAEQKQSAALLADERTTRQHEIDLMREVAAKARADTESDLKEALDRLTLERAEHEKLMVMRERDRDSINADEARSRARDVERASTEAHALDGRRMAAAATMIDQLEKRIVDEKARASSWQQAAADARLLACKAEGSAAEGLALDVLHASAAAVLIKQLKTKVIELKQQITPLSPQRRFTTLHQAANATTCVVLYLINTLLDAVGTMLMMNGSMVTGGGDAALGMRARNLLFYTVVAQAFSFDVVQANTFHVGTLEPQHE